MPENISKIDLLVSVWGEWRAPEDLMELFDSSPKITMHYINDDGEKYSKEMPDQTSVVGSKYYARERELLWAIEIIESSGTMRITNANNAKSEGADAI